MCEQLLLFGTKRTKISMGNGDHVFDMPLLFATNCSRITSNSLLLLAGPSPQRSASQRLCRPFQPCGAATAGARGPSTFGVLILQPGGKTLWQWIPIT